MNLCVAVFDAYMKLSGYEMEESISRETSGGLRDLLLAVGTKTSPYSRLFLSPRLLKGGDL